MVAVRQAFDAVALCIECVGPDICGAVVQLEHGSIRGAGQFEHFVEGALTGELIVQRSHADAQRQQDDAEADMVRPQHLNETLGEDAGTARFGE